jgi:hypothetical protein
VIVQIIKETDKIRACPAVWDGSALSWCFYACLIKPAACLPLSCVSICICSFYNLK